MSNLVQIFAKNPIPGKVKTRVARDTSDRFACELHKIMCEHIIEVAQGAADAVEIWTTESDPPTEYFQQFGLPVLTQRGQDLGQRMQIALGHGLERHHKVAIVGADAYSLTSKDIKDSFKSLDNHSVALVPAMDGGYVLLAAKTWELAEFGPVEWGSDQALEQTLGLFNTHGMDHCLLPPRWDIDTLGDIQLYAPALLDLVRDRVK